MNISVKIVSIIKIKILKDSIRIHTLTKNNS